MCQTAPDGRTLCQCSFGMGNCQEDGSCQGFNPFAQAREDCDVSVIWCGLHLVFAVDEKGL